VPVVQNRRNSAIYFFSNFLLLGFQVNKLHGGPILKSSVQNV
jgi:hypothetical protein